MGAGGAGAAPGAPRLWPGMPVRVGAPGAAGSACTTAGADSNCSSVTVSGCGSSTCSHIPAACARPDVHGRMDNASEAVAELWLAVTFQALSTIAIRGIADSISATLQAVFRPAVLARHRLE